jgi:hypothetical protein
VRALYKNTNKKKQLSSFAVGKILF